MMIIHGCPADFQTWYSLKLAMIRSIPEPPWFGAFFSRWHCNYCLHWRRRFPGSRECAFDLCWVPQHTSVGWGDVQVPVAKMVWHTFCIFHICRLQWNCFHSPKIIQWGYRFFEVDQEIIATMQEQQYAHDWYLFHGQPALGQTAKLPSNHEESSNIMFDEQ